MSPARRSFSLDKTPPALDAERTTLETRAGPIGCYRAGKGPPILLVHSINAAASAYEVRPLFDALIAEHEVFAPDLPGFGASDRSDRHYDVDLYVEAILEVARWIERRTERRSLDALALSLSSEFLARAATQEPERFSSLAFISPTGFAANYANLKAPERSTREIPGLHAFFSFPLWSQGFFSALTSKSSIRFFLKKTFGGDGVPQEMIEYCWLMARQPGARHAPYAFVSGRLFSKDIQQVYKQLTQPVWFVHGTRGDFTDYRAKDWTLERKNWTIDVFETGALAHFEITNTFVARYRTFLAASRSLENTAQPSASPARSPSP